jgi:hypothetical protein
MADNQICIESLHQHVYTDTLQVREPHVIIEGCKSLFKTER